MDSESLLQFIILITGLAGALLNVRKIIYGFHVWIVCNALVVYSSLQNGLYGMVLLYGVYIAICVYGLYTWKVKSAC